MATATHGAATEDEAIEEEPIELAHAREAVARYCREMGQAIPVHEVLGLVLGREDRRPGSEADAHERLLSCTGAVVAASLTIRPAAHRGWRQLLGAEHEDDCVPTARRLALAATGQLDAHEEKELERHLDSCLPCQALEARAARAERAFEATLLMGIDVTPRDVTPTTTGAAR